MRQQFIVTSSDVELPGWTVRGFAGQRLLAGSDTRVAEDGPVVIIGLAADPGSLSAADPGKLRAAFEDGGPAHLASVCDHLVGRFIVLAGGRNAMFAIPDGWGSLQAFYGSEGRSWALSSSPQAIVELGLGDQSRVDPTHLDHPSAHRFEYRSVGKWCPVSGAARLRAAHLLELLSGESRRLPLPARTAEAAELVEELGWSTEALATAHGGPWTMPLTAGVDSRLLALAAVERGLEPEFFTFTPTPDPTPDSEIASEVADRLGCPHRTIALPEAISPSTKAEVVSLRGQWRDLDKMREIEYFARLDGPRRLVLNGNGGEILTGGFYGSGPFPLGRQLTRALCLGPKASESHRRGFDDWYTLARVSEAAGPIAERYYWEQRMPHWGSDFFAEKAPFVDEASPFCSRRTLAAAPAATGRQLRGKIVDHLAQSRLRGIPINPHDRPKPFSGLAVARAIHHLAMDLVVKRS